MLMAIHIHPLFENFALISKLGFEPSACSCFSNHAFDSECRQNYIVDMLTQNPRAYSVKCLRCEVNANIMQDGFIVKKGVMAMLGK